jgi:arginine decarboxylase-like protein
MPDGNGFEVNVGGVRDYSGALADDKALVSEVDGLVSQADVGNESWGIVGLFVHGKYTEMLGDLHDLLHDMSDGLQSGADKMTATADVYQSVEDTIAKVFDDALALLESADQGGN